MPTLTHNEAHLAAHLLEAYGEILLSLKDNDGEVVLENTPENRVLATAIINQHDPDATGCVVVNDYILVNEVALAGYLRKRLVGAEVDCPECERCGMECGGEVSDDGMDFRPYRCEECDFQYCRECYFGRHEPDCPVIDQLGSTITANGAMPES